MKLTQVFTLEGFRLYGTGAAEGVVNGGSKKDFAH